MDLAALVLFLVLYYIRPQEWIGAIKPLMPVTVVMVFAIVSIFMRPGGFSRKSLFKTPHDLLMGIYCVWMVVASPDMSETFKSVYPLYLFYAVAVQALTNVDRMRRFLNWWSFMIVVLAVFALLSVNGYDPTGAEDIVNGRMKGRLIINTSLFNNPNALGHSVVPVISLVYFLFIWERPIFAWIGAIPLFALPMYCVYLTMSKGAFLCGFATILASQIFGRGRMMQILVIVIAVTVGVVGLKSLPRMNELDKSKNDEAIQGRVKAFTFGLRNLQNGWFGIGKDNFVSAMKANEGIRKASHSSYVQIGCELGKPGLFLYLAMMITCFRTLYTAKTRNTDEERVRRILFTMLIGYLVSSWMVDFAYRASFFLMIGSVGAFHRLMLRSPHVSEEMAAEAEEEAETVQMALAGAAAGGLKNLSPVTPGSPPRRLPALTPALVTNTTLAIPVRPAGVPVRRFGEPEEVETDDFIGIGWNKLTWKDGVLFFLVTWAFIRFWAYVITVM